MLYFIHSDVVVALLKYVGTKPELQFKKQIVVLEIGTTKKENVE